MEASAQTGEITLAGRPRESRATPHRRVRSLGIIGTGEVAEQCVSVLCREATGAHRCTVFVDTREPGNATLKTTGLPVSGPLADLSRGDLVWAADEYVLAFAPEDTHHAVSATWRLICDDLDFKVMPGSMGCVYPLLRSLGWAEMPVVSTERGVWLPLARAWKRTLDVVTAAALLTLLLPFMAVIALLIRLESPGPAIFTQERVGKHGRGFRILKFRTMVADAHRDEARIAASCAADPRFVKIDRDPRVTRLGRVLRRTSIDELPQLWNVLRGQMSLVGPRPSQPSEVEHYAPQHFTRLLVRPGVTGMWQVSGRSDLCFEDAVALDAGYVLNWSPLLDLKILLKTVVVVLRCRGAC